MPTSVKVLAAISCVLALSAACVAQDDGGGGDESMEADELSTKTVRIPATGSVTFTINATKATTSALIVDCHPPANPDLVGPAFKVSAPSLGIASPEPRAGYFSRAGAIPAGKHVLTFTGVGGPATCSVRTTAVSRTCHEWTETRSVNTNHTHYAVGSDTSKDWEAFPASGNHWGAWAKWTTVYDRPVKRGYLLHNLEHGGLVFSYKCASASASGCAALRDQMVGLANAFGQGRVIVTPDPTQPTKFAVRGWRAAYTADCLDETSALAFAKAHYRHGREDEDSNPPIPFDPTGTNVPCQDLMAAPDSCN